MIVARSNASNFSLCYTLAQIRNLSEEAAYETTIGVQSQIVQATHYIANEQEHNRATDGEF